MSASRTAMTQMLGSQFATILATGVGLAILGRLLTPEAFGQFAIAMAVFQLFKSVANFGLRQYLIRDAAEPDSAALSRAVGISFALALAGCILMWGAAGTGAALVSPGLGLVFVPMGLALLPGALSLAAEVRLYRGLSFGRPAWATLASTLADLAMALTLARAGFGPVALAMGVLASETVSCLVLRGLRPDGLGWPRPRIRATDMAAFGRFGTRITVINTLPNVVSLGFVSSLGAFAGIDATGLYNRARRIVEMLDRLVLDGIGPVILPVVSDALRRGVPLRQVLANNVDYMTALCWPALGGVALLAEPLVRLLLGAQWDAAVPAVQILAISGIALPVVKLSVKMFTALDALEAYLRIQLVTQALALGLGIVGAMISLEAFCAAVSLAALIKGGWIWSWLNAHAGGPSGMVRRAAGRGAIVTIGTLLPVAWLVLWGGLGQTALVVVGVSTAILAWTGMLALTRHPLARDLLALTTGLRCARRG